MSLIIPLYQRIKHWVKGTKPEPVVKRKPRMRIWCGDAAFHYDWELDGMLPCPKCLAVRQRRALADKEQAERQALAKAIAEELHRYQTKED